VAMKAEHVNVVVAAMRMLLAQLPQVDILWSLPSDLRRFLPVENEWLSASFYSSTAGGSDTLVGSLSERVRLELFTAQKSVLSHSAVRGFVTQCGSNSCLEGVYFGKPIVGMAFPSLDQEHNAMRVAEFGAGIALPWGDHPSAQQIVEAWAQVLTDPVFARRARDAAHLMHRAGGADKAVDFLEDIQTVGWKHLIPPIYDDKSHWAVRLNADIGLLWLILVDAPIVIAFIALWRKARTIAIVVVSVIVACIFAPMQA
jgi:hypothetical protein